MKNRPGRPMQCRRIVCDPDVVHFKPAGIPSRMLEHVRLSLDELEALRLADLEGEYQADAAAHMGVSRQTFGRIIATAHRKVAEALLGGKEILIEGGHVTQKHKHCPGTQRSRTEKDE
ncbi:MAG: hypothetical protein C0600_16580 [Ignavibacteria bacterium]|nr:MAG: hypothetical protein C0600_16580 [Ignavibacteria bacterium]